MAQVFICYDRQDSWFADVVQSKLEKNGHTTLMDLEILSAGDDWQDKLDRAIRSSQAFVVIMTPEPRASEPVAYEWAFALGAEKRVIPIELEATEFPTRLDGLHRLQFTNKSYDWPSLLDQLKKVEASNPTTTIPDGRADPIEGHRLLPGHRSPADQLQEWHWAISRVSSAGAMLRRPCPEPDPHSEQYGQLKRRRWCGQSTQQPSSSRGERGAEGLEAEAELTLRQAL